VSQDNQIKPLVEAIWNEIEGMIEGVDLDPIAEVQLFGYFPALKLSTLFGSTFVRERLPLNLLPLGPSVLLLKDELPEEKAFYIYMVIRERLDGGLRLSYVFPFVDWTGSTELKVQEVSVKNEDGRQQVIDLEKEIPSFARLWLSEE
jgi:hypothetical protein